MTDGCKTWFISKKEIGSVGAFETWIWQSLEKVSWTDKRTIYPAVFTQIARNERSLEWSINATRYKDDNSLLDSKSWMCNLREFIS